MGDSTHSTTSRDKVRVHRARLRHQGLRPIQIWVPDVRPPPISGGSPPAITRGRQQHAREDQTFIEAVTDWHDA